MIIAPPPDTTSDFDTNNAEFITRNYRSADIPDTTGFVFDPDNPTYQTERLSYVLYGMLRNMEEHQFKIYQDKGLKRLLIETIQQVCPHLKIRTPYGNIEITGYE